MEAGPAGLTLGEARVARLIAEGRTDEEVAERLGISVVDVDTNLAELYRKLGVRSRTELALLISPSTPETGGPVSDPTLAQGAGFGVSAERAPPTK
jgi:DNA-binding CsgD family transcriptional regulator